MHSFEIEGVSKHDDDSVFEIKTLANRAHDCFGHFGVAKEVSLLLKIPLERNPLLASSNAWLPSEKVVVHIEDPKLCRRYIGLIIENVKVGPSPEWLMKRLARLGQKSINNIVDATNLVMFEIGQPLHAFDFNKFSLKEGRAAITVRCGEEHEKILTLGGGDHTVTKDMLLITDGDSGTPIGIAGIKGGAVAEITTETKNIVIESANFDPVSIRKTAQKLGFRTEASVRFEHELSPELAYPAIVSVAQLILTIASGDETFVEGMVDEYPEPVEVLPVRVAFEEIGARIGTDIPKMEVERILRSLSSGFEQEGDDYVVTPPFERLDLIIKQDLIEEVGRIYRYEHVIPKKLLHVENIAVNPKALLASIIRSTLVDAGCIEVFTYVFQEHGVREVENPIADDKKYLRKDLGTGLSASLEQNTRNAPLLGLDTIRIFEIGNVFTEKGEKWLLGIGVKNVLKKKEKETTDLHALEKLLSEKLGCEVAGTLDGTVLEIDLDMLVSKVQFHKKERLPKAPAKKSTVYKKISPYPFIARDIAIFVPAQTKPETVLEIIKKEADDLVVMLRLFDIYRAEDKVSYAYSIVFQSKERTLTDIEITPLMEHIKGVLEKNEGWKVR